MPRRMRSLVGVLLAVVLAALAVPGTGAVPRPEQPATRTVAGPNPDWLVPDLRMAGIRDFRVTYSGSRKLLRFSTTIVNVGEGPFEVRGARTNSSESTMRTSQIIRDKNGLLWHMRRPTDAVMRYSGDGHDHWHVQRIVVSEIRPIDKLDAAPRRAAKTGFCFFDTTAYRLSLPGAPSGPRYFGSSCGVRGSLKALQGISVGWGDKYSWNLAYQWIDISNMPDGVYRVCSTADPQGWYIETNDVNNHTLADIRITGNSVSLVGQAWWACNDARRPG